jgi:hypothetical protein
MRYLVLTAEKGTDLMNLNHAWLWKHHCDVADQCRTEFKHDNPNTDELLMGGNSSETTDTLYVYSS